ncbi:4-hydroxybenzoate octaprenyltransferase [Pectinatus cerevisiiphilus]|uniref:4-hydroxybenzoate polyprenyltransferase n=1 Tax=Pectinatus cerevisiiphilus TaxID=86956 RepID=A0A4R3K2K9_9FIRM|nr:4-hydroxybenzoate octaprenyltransferase [Pectinatus cerevisiiphilus]TCS76682.1 4-hydroxybenzoate polyprenyltransferase [Pectinatus cerevisiiphilus]
MNKISAHINNIALHHMVFALPFAYMGTFLAAQGLPSLHDFIFITLAMIGARSSAMVLDNLIDLKYDRLQPRLANRPMVKGAVKPAEVLLLLLICMVLFIFSALQLAPICIYLTPLAIIVLLVYPYTKRFTFMCHFVLGAALAMAPIGSYIAITGTLSLPILLLGLGVCLWIGGFDAIYGSQDEAFDRAHGLHSLATQFTARRVFSIISFVHAASIICFILVGLLYNLPFVYYIGIVIAVITLIYQHSIVSFTDYSRLTQVYFMRNGIVSIVIFIFTAISILQKY